MVRHPNRPLYLLFESALLFETGAWKSMDLTLLVTPEELRIRGSPGATGIPAEVTARMNHQWKMCKRAGKLYSPQR